MTKMTATFRRRPGSVFVDPVPPKGANTVTNAKNYSQDWVTVAKQLVAEAPVPTPEPTPVADVHEIRIYAVDSVTGHRQRLFTGQPSDDTDNLCQAYATLAECRVESHDAASAKVYHPETYPIPTLADWVEVHNANDGTLIFVGLREKGFDARCRKYADAKGVGLRVDSAHLNHSQFYTPKNEALSYAKQNAEHFARKHGFAVADAVGVLAITVVGWAFYVVGGTV